MQSMLKALAEETGETVYLCLPDGDQVLFASQINSRYRIKLEDSTGQRYPMQVTSAGKLFLSERTTSGLMAYFENDPERYTDETIVTVAEMANEIESIKNSGISWTRDEFEKGYIGIAAPILNEQREMIGAPALGAPSFRVRDAAQEASFAALVKETAEAISRRIN